MFLKYTKPHYNILERTENQESGNLDSRFDSMNNLLGDVGKSCNLSVSQ